MRPFRCLFQFHSPDDECRCRRCGKVRHRPGSRTEWEPEEGIDTSYGIWWNYQEVQVKVTICRRCGLIVDYERTGWMRGNP